MVSYITHPLIRPDTVEERLYQLELAARAAKSSTLAVLPTGLGKTVVALLAIVQRLPKGRVLVLSPTKPLAEQHAAFLRNSLTIQDIALLTGSVPPGKRNELWSNSRVVVATPQVIENDLLGRRIELGGVSHITFDEAHRAVGSYAYVYIAEKYFQQCSDPLVLGITASPGSDEERIQEVCKNLHIASVLSKTDDDTDVAPYVFNKYIERVTVQVPQEIKGLKSCLDRILGDRIAKLGHRFNYKRPSKREILDLQASLQAKLRSAPDPEIYQKLSVLAEIMKVSHGIELIETQGTSALSKYIERLQNEARSSSGSKAAKRLMADPEMRYAINLLSSCKEHPKFEKVKEIVSDQISRNPASRVIVFTNYRDTAEEVTSLLSKIEGVKPVRFVGQASRNGDTGLSQKQQVEILDRFRAGEYNTLVATSVAEEGLDIPSTDLVVFFEPVPSEIRSIQRKGRTGRRHAGRVVVLEASGTMDSAYFWSSRKKEKSMQSEIKSMQSMKLQDGQKPPEPQKKLGDFPEEVSVFADQRETHSGILPFLEKMGVRIALKTLEVGDYVLSDRLCIERKTTVDFLGSMLDSGRLFRQLADLARTYDRPVLLIEGEDLFTARQVHPNAIRGLLSSIIIDFGVPVITTRNEEETAAYISVMARREQLEKKRGLSIHGKKSSMTLSEQQEYIVSALPEVGNAVATNLLRHFGSVERVMSAPREELLKVELVGPKTADRIREVAGGEYKG